MRFASPFSAGAMRKRRTSGTLQQRVEILVLVHDEPVELALARVDAARGDVHLVATLGEPVRPAREVARLRVPDPEDAKPCR